uniref:Putative chromatin binding protein n=1 Tax=Trypanosoma vivax (strain Y486) TaxID=1055687 RepID=G0UBN1_TRYVY|nr:putative chromatin binding protein, fragment [Trypanosoma vivax Y486]
MEADPNTQLNCAEGHGTAVHTAIAVCGCGHDGRLGLGKCDSQSRVVLVPFFLPPAGSEVSPFGSIRAARVGAYHNFVITTTGVYCWGLNENGQLGLGRGSPSCVTVPTRVPFFDEVTVLEISCGAYHTFAWTSSGLFACGMNEDGQLGVPEESDHFSFTKVLSAAQIGGTPTAEGKDQNLTGPHNEDDGACRLIKCGQLTHVSCGTYHTLIALRDVTVASAGEDDSEEQQHFPVLIAATGKGDFGALGFDGDAWSALKSKTKSMQAALQNATHSGHVADVNALGTAEKRWKPLKQRRAAFSTSQFRCVGLPVLLDRSGAAAGSASFEVESLHAMHLHSAVILREVMPSQELLSTDTAKLKTFHWGCYYCNEVEDDASSVPREERSGDILHAGNEILFRYSPSSLPAAVEVKGTGVLGLGEENSHVTSWAQLPLPSGGHDGCSVRTVTGREHFLIQLGNLVVFGFGDNMHGQLAAGAVQDTLLSPTVVVRAGDELTSPACCPTAASADSWRVEHICDVRCGMRHSVFVLGVTPAPSKCCSDNV